MPSDVQAALNGLSVRSLVPNIVDTINITIYNGENGNCIPSKLLPNTSYRPKCHMTSIIFQITVNGFISPEDLRGNVEIASKSGILSLAFRQILIGSLVTGVFVIGVLRCLYLRRLKKRIDKYVILLFFFCIFYFHWFYFIYIRLYISYFVIMLKLLIFVLMILC